MKVKPPREKGTSFFKSKKFLTVLIGIFIIMLMVMSVLDLWKGTEDSYDYHGVEFARGDNGWSAYISNNFVVLPYSPAELENVTDVDFSGFNSLEKIYLTTDNPVATYKSMDYFRRRIPLSPTKVLACIPDGANVTECGQLPLKDCADADNYVGVIVFRRAENFTSSLFSGTCLVLEGSSEDLMKVFDKSMLRMLGV